jgi:tetratricopeptide (TPR) repeat protein
VPNFRRLLSGFLFSVASILGLDGASSLESARRLLTAGRIAQAEKLTRQSIETGTDVAAAQAVLGDVLFRRANFEAAEQSYRAALAVNPACARAYLGLGRIEQAQFRRRSARDLLARAFGLDPRDPEIVIAYAGLVSDATSRATLLRTAVQLTQHSDVKRAEESLGQLQIEQRLSGARPARLASQYRGYAIRLSPFQPVSFRPEGLLLPVRINKGRLLHLLLDTGASGITLALREPDQFDLVPLGESSVGGLGRGGPRGASVTLANSVFVGDLRFENCLVEVIRQPLMKGVDGVIGMNLFEDFEIRLDPRTYLMQLTPFAERPGVLPYDRRLPDNPAGSAVVWGFRHLLLMPTKVNNRAGLFLLDTGSAATAIARELAWPVLVTTNSRPFHGVNGEVADAPRLSPVTLRIAGRNYMDAEPISLDLSEISQRHGVEISGILGFSALSHAPVTINYRDGVVDLGKRH